MPVVPFKPNPDPAAEPQTNPLVPRTLPAPDPTYVMMAAAQMHAAGRLITPETKPDAPALSR